MNTDFYEKEYDYITFLTSHNELFRYDYSNKIWYGNNNSIIIGNKQVLTDMINKLNIDEEKKEKISSSLGMYSDAELVAIDYNNKKELIVESVKDSFEKYKYLEMLRQEQQDEKFIAGSIESEYDNYFSVEEEVDEKERETFDY